MVYIFCLSGFTGDSYHQDDYASTYPSHSPCYHGNAREVGYL